MSVPPAVEWRDGGLVLLDQRELPAHERYIRARDVSVIAEAIRGMAVRGAPAIGCAAAYGVALAARSAAASGRDVRDAVRSACAELGVTRPTAVNLRWALERLQNVANEWADAMPEALAERLLDEAHAVFTEDLAACKAIGRNGAALLPADCTVLTHCNAGALATAGYGTALGVVRAAVAAGKRVRVYAGETRPYLQGALTAWELVRDGIDVTVITDGMAGHVLASGRIQCVVVGADRVVANGDVANKIGTYGLAVLARENGVPFYVAAPVSTLDLSLASGASIPIEERAAREVLEVRGVRVAPEGVRVYNPAFDVTPARYISAIVTERGVARPPYEETLAALI